MFSTHPDKSPGEDGFSPGFYQHYWNIIGSDVANAWIQWLLEGSLLESLNNTTIVLIPKKTDVVSMVDLQPILLCNVIYKIM